jgi:hypothetical protein
MTDLGFIFHVKDLRILVMISLLPCLVAENCQPAMKGLWMKKGSASKMRLNVTVVSEGYGQAVRITRKGG